MNTEERQERLTELKLSIARFSRESAERAWRATLRQALAVRVRNENARHASTESASTGRTPSPLQGRSWQAQLDEFSDATK